MNTEPIRRQSIRWARRRVGNIDPLEAYGLPSRGETGLFDYKAQEKYYNEIVERYIKFYAASKGESGMVDLEQSFADMLIKDDSPKGTSKDMSVILMAMRKLREGITSSRRCDHFAQRAYVFIVHAGILARHWETYQPALNYLLNCIHPQTPLSPPELQEVVSYQALDLACRQDELMDAFAVKQAHKINDRVVNAVLISLVQDNWVRFWRLQKLVDGYQHALMEFSRERMRTHTLKCLGRSYLKADQDFVERSADASWSELVKGGVGWQLQEDKSVVIRKPRAG
ncbi:hypothetical protein K470DRAFT_282393 [Piedraia hortae CBS 480.64]|uniref:CSN8/PSMD8/EIF3K domain-containing protein n=1 Tax=Piedraia hortae CBS 480.64 TaxID=1314780 RepID=A0A6A7BYX1_9PEZI|nr:hypothetical protein K470DRAFT_282393 [Piedraia hortae CBS 480.64]